jgi:hypothetical protein
MMKWGMDPIYTQIAGQLRRKYQINLAEHIESVTVLHNNILEGIWFTPKDHHRLIDVLLRTNAFLHDNRADPFHAAAASQTQGEGYREIAETSVHCQISAATVNMHIDRTGFIWRGPNGETLIGPDAIAHILDELKWPELVKWVSGKSKFAGMIVGRMHPVVPSVASKFMPQLGIQFDITRGANRDFSKQWALTLDLRWGCTGYDCTRTETFTGLNFVVKHK